MKEKLIALAEYMVNNNESQYLKCLHVENKKHQDAVWTCINSRNAEEGYYGGHKQQLLYKSFFALILAQTQK